MERVVRRATALLDPGVSRTDLVRMVLANEFKEYESKLDDVLRMSSRKRPLSGPRAPAEQTTSPSAPSKRKNKRKRKLTKRRKQLDWSACRQRNVFLKIAYIGEAYHGFVTQHGDPNAGVTVEDELMRALEVACLVKDRWNCQYSRCGRTDKGVSALGNVVSLFLRSKLDRGVGMVPREGWRAAADNSGAGVGQGSRGDAKGSKSGAGEEDREGGSGTGEALGGSSGTTMRSDGPIDIGSDDITQEIDYPHILNSILPPDIRVLGWAPAPLGATARHDCHARTYKYFLYDDGLNLAAMREALSHLRGHHDFKNFCKIDHVNVSNFVRAFDGATIRHRGPLATLQNMRRERDELGRGGELGGARDPDEPIPTYNGKPLPPASGGGSGPKVERKASSTTDPDHIFEVTIQGNAFLWHQIRYTMSLLLMVGRGDEKPSIFKDLLNMRKWPAKPQYDMASDIPLVLCDCLYRKIRFIYHRETSERVLSDFHWAWRRYTMHAHVMSLFQRRVNAVLSQCPERDAAKSQPVRGLQLQRRKNRRPRHAPLDSRASMKSYGAKLQGLHGKRLKRQQEQSKASAAFRDFHVEKETARMKVPYREPRHVYALRYARDTS